MAAVVSEPGGGGGGDGVGSMGLGELLGKWLNLGGGDSGGGTISAPVATGWAAGTYTPPAPAGSVMPSYTVIGGAPGQPNFERDLVLLAALFGSLLIVTKL